MKYATLLFALLISTPAAAVYKCVDAEGNIGFSETPCAVNEQSSQMNVRSSGPKLDARTCELASLYAEDVFKRMQRHKDSGKELDRYGGVYGAGAAIVGVVNYVYGYRHDDKASARRVAALTRSKCENGGFGRIRFEELPKDEYYEFDEFRQVWMKKGEMGGMGQNMPRNMPHNMNRDMQQMQRQSNRGAASAEAMRQRQCAKMREAIESLDSQMRGGYSGQSGEDMRRERRRLRDQVYAACR